MSTITELSLISAKDFFDKRFTEIFLGGAGIPGEKLYSSLSSYALTLASATTNYITNIDGTESIVWSDTSSKKFASILEIKNDTRGHLFFKFTDKSGDSIAAEIIDNYYYDLISFSYKNTNGTPSAADDYLISGANLGAENNKIYPYFISTEEGNKSGINIESKIFDKKNGYTVTLRTRRDSTEEKSVDEFSTTAKYNFYSKSDGFKVDAELILYLNKISSSVTLSFSSLTLENPDYFITGLSVAFTREKFDEMNFGTNHIDQDLSTVKPSILNILLPALQDAKNSITIKSKKGITVDAGADNDIINGNSGSDIITDGGGDDIVKSGSGNDRLIGGNGNDTIDGGTGYDCIDYSLMTDSITVNLKNGISSGNEIGNNLLKNIEKVLAGLGNDILIGSDSGCQLEGSGGDDKLTGGIKSDTLIGGTGSDTLNGGLGKDMLTGGDGSDYFIFSSTPSSSNIDTITDFSTGSDKIQLSLSIFAAFSTLGLIDSSMILFGNGVKTATTTSHRLIYDSTGGSLFYDADGFSNQFKPIKIVLIGNKSALSHLDFEIIN